METVFLYARVFALIELRIPVLLLSSECLRCSKYHML